MIVYGLSCALSALVAHLGTKSIKGKNARWAVLFFSCLPLALVAALRYDVGEDYLSGYVAYFDMIRMDLLPHNQQMEWIFHIINVGIAKAGGSYVWVFTICAFLFYSLAMDQILRDSPDAGLSVFLLTGMGYVFVFFNAMRQMVGCAILLWSLRFVQEKRFLPFLICVAVATGFHLTCAFFIVVYFWSRLRITPVRALILTGIILSLSQLIAALVRSLMSKTIYAVYLSSVFDNGKTAWVTIAIHLVLLAFLSWNYSDNQQYRMYYNLLLAALWVSFFSGSIVLGIRGMWMFGLTTIISLPMAIQAMKEKRNADMLKACVILFYSLYILITVGLQNSNSVLPYQTVLSRWL